MKKQITSLLFLVAILYSCTNSQSVSSTTIDSDSIDKSDTESALLWQQTSAEYSALCIQAFNTAKLQLNSLFEKGEFERTPVIIMDLDETVLDNSPYNAMLLLENKNYTVESWNAWVELQEATAVPGAVNFIEYALEKDYQIIFVSNRDHLYLKATLDNVNSFGFNFNEKNFALKRGTSQKTNRRKKINEDFEIVMLIGDNLADFNDKLDSRDLTISKRKELVEQEEENFGVKYIILPNTMYGNWQKALQIEDNKNSFNKDQKGPRQFLRTYTY